MKIIGVSGFIGAGKTTLLNYLKEKYHIVVIDADQISKDVINHEQVKEFLKAKIPSAITKVGEIDRQQVRTVVFLDTKLNDEFTSIMWPLISARINELIANDYQKETVVVVEAAIISGLAVNFDVTILLQKDDEQRIDLVVERDERDITEIKSISAYQMNRVKDVQFDYILKNNDNIEVFYQNIDKLIDKISIRFLKG